MLSAEDMAQDFHPARENVTAPKAEYSPYTDDHFLNCVFFIDTPLHAAMSTDAGMVSAIAGPEGAYRVLSDDVVQGRHCTGWIKMGCGI